MKKRNLIISWVLRILVTLGFLAASLGKITSNIAVIKMFEDWGFPDGFYLIIGIFELLFAVMLLIPKTLKIALIGLSLLMVGAMITHLINDPMSNIIRPIIFLILMGGIYYINFPIKKAVRN